MKNLVIIFVLGLVLSCSKDDDPTPKFILEADWIASSWYCNNPNNCVIKEEDKAATLSFSIVDDGESYSSSPGKWYKPSCTYPPCKTLDWEVSSITYSNDILTITWSNNYTFSAVRKGDKFQGKVDTGSYVWNDSIELISQ